MWSEGSGEDVCGSVMVRVFVWGLWVQEGVKFEGLGMEEMVVLGMGLC